jgi:UDP-glucose 4-epimerase
VKLLVTGGAGYVGSVTSRLLLDAGHEVVVLDNLSTGFREAVAPDATFVEADIADAGEILTPGAGFDAVLHFAGLIAAGESMLKPELYWDHNVQRSLRLLEAVRAAGVGKFVFSSTAAVYGNPTEIPITENAVKAPTNTYGATKLTFDFALTSEAFAHGLAAVSLRYFNVAGASGAYGEDHHPETHLIPLVLQAAAGRRGHVSVFGSDYPTRDGSAVRDYIHVEDLGEAHQLALDRIEPGRHVILNLGTGTGYSVREVIDAAKRVTGRDIAVTEEPRRPGDPAQLVATNARAREVLGWEPRRTLEDMIADAWAWHEAHPDGYGD